jgi:hypothetical protein
MISSTTLEQHITEPQARATVARYLTHALGVEYGPGHSEHRNGCWCFMILCRRNDMNRTPAVGVITVDAATGQVVPLTDEQLRNVKEAGAVQAAQARGELARNEQGYVVRAHARIKASVWISDQVDLKVGATGGAFLPLDPPVWRFAIDCQLEDVHLDPLGVIDVNAKTGQVVPLTDEQLEAIRGCVRAAKQLPALAPAT